MNENLAYRMLEAAYRVRLDGAPREFWKELDILGRQPLIISDMESTPCMAKRPPAPKAKRPA